MVLAAEEDGQDPDLRRGFLDREIEDRPMLGDLPQTGPEILRKVPWKRAWPSLSMSSSIARTRGLPQQCGFERVAERPIGGEQMVEDRVEVAVAGARPDDLKGHARGAWR